MTAATADVKRQIDGAVATISLCRPERLNALTFSMIEQLRDAILDCGQRTDIRVVVLRGEGASFCAGDNLKGMGDPPFVDDPLRRLRDGGYASVVSAIRQLDKPVIGIGQGHVLGAGLEIFMATDIRIVHADASLGIPFARLGMAGGTFQLPRLVGLTRAAAMLFSAESISGVQAVDYGLATEVGADESDVERRMQVWAEKLQASSTRSIGLMKRTLYRCFELSWNDAVELNTLNFFAARMTADVNEAVEAWRSTAGASQPHSDGSKAGKA